VGAGAGAVVGKIFGIERAMNWLGSWFGVNVPSAGAYDTSYDIWFNGRATELMIWMNKQGDVGPIGSYQAVAHRCAQMMLETESARSAVYYAGWVADNEPETAPLAASMAKAYAADAGWRVTASALQVHGGIGFTWEHDLHFFLKRAKADGLLYGSASEHRERVAELSGLAAEPASV